MKDWFAGVTVQLAVLTACLIVLVAVFSVLKARRPNEKDKRLLALANNITEGLIAVVLIGSLVYVTLRYS